MAVERKKEKRRGEKVNDYSGTIVSERRRGRTHTLGLKIPNKLGLSCAKLRLNWARMLGLPLYICFIKKQVLLISSF
jgi:hypothetical protein